MQPAPGDRDLARTCPKTGSFLKRILFGQANFFEIAVLYRHFKNPGYDSAWGAIDFPTLDPVCVSNPAICSLFTDVSVIGHPQPITETLVNTEQMPWMETQTGSIPTHTITTCPDSQVV